MVIFGTRPEIIRLSLIIKLLDCYAQQILVHTGQNYDPSLSDVFIRELGLRAIDHHLSVESTSFGQQVSQILAKCDELLEREQPERVLILGDTNSGLSAIVAARRRIPIYHLEAGNRCYDNRVPEESNRRIIDHSSDILLPYTERSAANLVAEGVRRERIFVVGNPILEVIEQFTPQIEQSEVLKRLNLDPKSYFIATMHRAENVDSPRRLASLVQGLTSLTEVYDRTVVLSVHPRTAERIRRYGIAVDKRRLRLEPPFGFFDFIYLEKNAFGIVTDSGTVQEEACIFRIPNVTIRDVTERPETTECGSNILVGADPKLIVGGMQLAQRAMGEWTVPEEYLRRNVSKTVAKILLSHCE